MPSQSVFQFDVWQPGYAGATVYVRQAGTNDLAPIYFDPDLTDEAPNPQTLDTREVDGLQHGKFERPIYTGYDYWLDVDSTDETGNNRLPLYSLDGENASDATVTPTGGTASVPLDDLAGRTVHALNHGALGTSSATNTATLTAAIARASSLGGGEVVVPAGTWPYTALSIPANVVVTGTGRGTVLTSTTAGKCVTLTGDGAGLRGLTLDGLQSSAGSTGLFTQGNDATVLDDVIIKRFETGLHAKGGRRARWKDFEIHSCGTGAKLHGDSDAGGTADGDEWRDNSWHGGRVQHCTTAGVDFSYEDRFCGHMDLQGVAFTDNTGTALANNGARFLDLENCVFTGNTKNLTVQDDSDGTAWEENTVIGLNVRDTRFNGGTIEIEGTAQDIIFERALLEGVEITLTTPENPILAKDCIEDAAVTLSGDGTKWIRSRSSFKGASAGITSGNTATKAWSIPLAPGQIVYLEAKVIGNQRDGENTAAYHISVPAHRPGDELDYDTQTADFTVGDILTGGNSGCTARIVADSDSGDTGTLTLRDIVPGPDGDYFEDNEIITDESGGSATVNGTLQAQAAALLDSVTQLITAFEDDSDWGATFVANGQEIEVQVTGDTGQTIEWLIDVEVVST